MVFENLTLFEVHFEDATFGPTQADDRGESTSESVAPADAETTEDGGLPVGRLLVASVVVSLIVAFLARKLLGDDEIPDVDIDAPEGPVDVSLDE